MQERTGIRSDRVWLDESLQPATLFLEGDKIVAIQKEGRNKISSANIKDYKQAVIMPGVIDAHVHINEPGRTEWEGFETATKAAAIGGITTLVDMPLNSSPVVTTKTALAAKTAACKNKLFVNCGFWAGAVSASVKEVKELIDAGCLGVKVFLSHSGIDEFPSISLEDLATLMEGIKSVDAPILAHCELDFLPADTTLATHPTSYEAYLKSRPKSWENEAVKKFVSLSEKYQCKAHIVHLASDEVLSWLQEMKNKKVPFTIETCPHYLLFCAEDINDHNTIYKCAPPIREKKNGQHLKQALKSGLIDFISSDHSPAPAPIKELESGNFAKAWGGIAGLQFLLSASWTALKNDMTLAQFIPLLTSKPAHFLGLQDRIGTLAVGYDADITIWSPENCFEVLEKDVAHKHKISPYLHQKLYGEILTTIVNGKTAYQNHVVQKTPYGHRFKSKEKVV